MRRVVITGIGAITPLGNDADSTWKGIREGVCGINRITQFDISDYPIHYAAEVKNYEPRDYFKPLEVKKISRVTQFGIISALEAYKDAGLSEDDIDHDRFSVTFGSGYGGGIEAEEYEKLETKGANAVSRLMIPKNLINMIAANVAIRLKAHGSCTPVVTACSTGTDCIGLAYRQIKYGLSDIVAAGSSESAIKPVCIAGFNVLGTLAKGDNPERLSIPFDLERKGFVMGEGAGCLILEELEHAQKRNAHIYGEIVGYGSTCDAFSLTAPDPGVTQAVRAIKMAMEEAGITKEQISYINAHGTGTKLNDKVETALLKSAFGETIRNIPVSSTKSMTGHLLGASGSVEAVILCKAIEGGFIPPTIGYEVPDPDCDLDYVVGKGRNSDIQYALSNSLGFGGHNAVIIIKK